MLQSDEKYARAIEYDTLGIELLARRMFLSRKGCLISESELENPFLLRAFRSAESCSAEAECTLDALDEALTDLQDDPELHELISQTFAKCRLPDKK
jgi:hypothetical protein